MARQKDGLCLRLLYEDIEKDFLVRKIEEICSDFRLDPSSIDIVLDLKIFSHHNRPFEWYCEKLPHLTEWRTFTIASGAFPKDLTGFKVGQHILPRLDWQSWRQEIGKPLPRIPTYGDYATLHPFLPSYIPGMNASASIRYTYDEYWIIMRGEGVLNPGGAGYGQFPANAQLLIEQPEYCGPHFSIGDNFIYEISLNKGKVGNLSQWLQATVNHHLTFAARQIANLSNQKE